MQFNVSQPSRTINSGNASTTELHSMRKRAKYVEKSGQWNLIFLHFTLHSFYFRLFFSPSHIHLISFFENIFPEREMRFSVWSRRNVFWLHRTWHLILWHSFCDAPVFVTGLFPSSCFIFPFHFCSNADVGNKNKKKLIGTTVTTMNENRR